MGNTITSTWAKVIHGVPQGSILGPLLFLIFINDLPMFMRENLTPILFADDISIVISHSALFDFKNKIKTIFNNLNEWFKNNLLSLNFSKTQFINFTTRKSNQIEITINHNNKIIPICNSTKFLWSYSRLHLVMERSHWLGNKKTVLYAIWLETLNHICLFLH